MDEEAERFLTFERWWGGHFLLTKDEIGFITEELFIGNKLALGGIQSSGGQQVDLRNIRAPIVVFASKGDNITPPQQALNWILDTYASTDDIRACGQVIIYMLHESIGHLGIFVSGGVAKREHRAMIDNLDVISTLPPGLYEMTIEKGGAEGGWKVGFAKRELSDIQSLDDSRREELFFIPVARVSEFNKNAYEQFVSPWMRMLGSPLSGEMIRRANPDRLDRWLWSEINPLMTVVGDLAGTVRDQRRRASPDNPFLRAEQQTAELMANWLDHFRDVRDMATETLFYMLYNPLHLAMRSEEADLLERRSQRLDSRSRQARAELERQVRADVAEGGVPEAVLRVLLWLARRRPVVDAQRFRLAEAALTGSAMLDSRQMRDAIRRQFYLLIVDEEAAIAALPDLVASADDRKAMLDVVDKVAAEIGGITSEQQDDLERVRRMLTAPVTEARTAGSRRRGPPPPSAETQRPLH
ncbi:MAG: DUF3141 domain-containing protein [Rhodospirillaceae bacterium]|nr:DUF3141 domain-containing protein [Rhodospirillales bacterium]